MALQDLLDLSVKKQQQKIGLSEERIQAIIPEARKYTAYWREYPDLFVDFMQTGGRTDIKLTFNLFFYQRVFLRVSMRYKYVYVVFPRAYSKSFLAVLVLMIRAILYPGARLFSTAGGKEQAAQILQEKVQDICTKIPAFRREIDWSRGATREGKDSCKYVFKSGSTIENLAARESSRGRRFHAGLIEECVGVDQKILQEVIIPTMNVSRRCMSGEVKEEEVLNQSQIYITTAGYKNTYSYSKLIQLLVRMVVEPDKAFIMGGTWRIPVLLGLQPKNFVEDLKRDSTFNEASFGREYESKWTGTVEDAFFDGEAFDHNRQINQPEHEASGRIGKNAYYIISVDVGRRGCDTVANIIKVNPQPDRPSIKSLVNIVTISDGHFEDQAIALKRLYYKYKAKALVVDGNGLGIGLVDYLVKPQFNPDTGDVIPDFGVINDPDRYYKKYQTKDCELDALYIIKANAPINTEAHACTQVAINSGKIKFLIDSRIAKQKLLAMKRGQEMTPEERADYLRPYVLTDILKEELMNLREENEGVNIILKQANRGIGKDKFSALEYGLYYIKQEEDSKKKKKKFNVKDFMLFS